MKYRSGFKFTAIVLACALPLAAQAVAGRVQFASGDVRLLLKDGSSRAAQKSDPVSEGDTIVTGVNSVAQLRMIDEGLIAVRPDTQLRIDAYVYAGREDGSERGVLGLVRGGFRTLTGVIGRSNKANYLVRTPNATIGIRGTDHEPLFIPQPAPGQIPLGTPGTYNKVNVGETFIESAGQRIELGANQSGFASLQPGAPPVRLERIPGFMRATPVQQGRDDKRQVRESPGGDQRRIASGPQSGPGGARDSAQPGMLRQGPGQFSAPPGGLQQPAFNQQTSGQLGFQQLAPNLTAAPADYYGVGADLAASGAAGSGAITAGVNGAQILLGADGFPALLVSSDGLQYARAGAPIVDAGIATFNDGGSPVVVRWGVYAGGAAVDSQGPRATQFFQFMGAQGTPAAVVTGLSASYGGVGGLVASSKLVTEGGVVGGAVTPLNTSISINAGNLTFYKVSMVDGQSRSWTGCAFACSAGSVPLTTFAKSGATLSGTGPGPGVTGRAQGAPVGPSGQGFVSSFDLKSTDGKTVTGAFAVKQ